MKKWLWILLVLLPLTVLAADTAVKDMTESTTPATTDILYLVGDPGGTPVDRKVTIAALTRVNVVVDSGSDAPYNVTTAQARAGTYFFNTYAGTKTYLLPATAEAGMAICVRNGQGNSQILRIDANTGDYIVKPSGARTSASAEYYGCSADAKNQICVVAADGTDWYVTSENGTCAEE